MALCQKRRYSSGRFYSRLGLSPLPLDEAVDGAAASVLSLWRGRSPPCSPLPVALFHVRHLHEAATQVVMDNVRAQAGVATVAAPSLPAMRVPSVVPAVAGVLVMVDLQAPVASATVKEVSPVLLPAAAMSVSTTSSAPSCTALADVIPSWVTDAAAQGVTLTSVYIFPLAAAGRGGEAAVSQAAATGGSHGPVAVESARRR